MNNQISETIKTIRGKEQWVKITRDNEKFLFARGLKGSLYAHDLWEYPHSVISTWEEAMENAKDRIDNNEGE